MSRPDTVYNAAGLRFCIQRPADDVSLPILHGAGERGNDISQLRKKGPWRGPGAEQFLHVAPQCPTGCHWAEFATEIGELVRFVLDIWPVDRDKVYATGLSMGGFGVWAAASANPGLFAALVPVCGGFTPPGKTSFAALLRSAKNRVNEKAVEPFKYTPVWVFHGRADTTVDVNGSRAVINALRRKTRDGQGRFKKTIYADVGHSCWQKAYSSPELYTWLLQQSLAMNRIDEAGHCVSLFFVSSLFLSCP
jgi:predicted peptidase